MNVVLYIGRDGKLLLEIYCGEFLDGLLYLFIHYTQTKVVGWTVGGARLCGLFLRMHAQDTMKTVCYALGVAGIIIAIYWLATQEVMGLPILIVGLCHIGLAARSEHVAMQIGCTGLAVVACVIGAMMLMVTKPMGAET